MIKQEGPASLYRGYTFHLLAMLAWMSIMPVATDFLMEKLPLYLDPNAMPGAGA